MCQSAHTGVVESGDRLSNKTEPAAFRVILLVLSHHFKKVS